VSVTRRITFAVLAAWLSRAVAVLANLVLLPVLFRFVDREELGLWLLMTNSQAYLGLLGLGLIPTITRHVALARGRGDPDAPLPPDARRQIGDLIATSRALLRGVAVAAFFLAAGAGSLLLGWVPVAHVTLPTALGAWVLICAAYAINVWVSYLDCLLAGVGYVGWDSLIVSALAVLTALANVVAVCLGGGLLTLAGILAASGLCQRFVVLAFLRRRVPELLAVPGRWDAGCARALARPALWAWLTALGDFLMVGTDGYFIALFRGAGDVPGYQAAYRLGYTLMVVAGTFGMASSVFVSQAWRAGDLGAVQRLTVRNAQLALAVMAAGVGFLLTAGREAIELWLGEGTFIGYPVLGIFCLTLTLNAQALSLTSGARATEDERYAFWTLAAGALNLLFTWCLIRPLGLTGVALGTLLGLSLTYFWYAVYRPMVRLQLDFLGYARKALGLWAAVFLSSLGLGWLAAAGLRQCGVESRLPVVAASLALSALSLAGGLWWGVLDAGQRRRASARLPFGKKGGSPAGTSSAVSCG
jgi:O-antigen/teichoic acid export membrane protein